MNRAPSGLATKPMPKAMNAWSSWAASLVWRKAFWPMYTAKKAYTEKSYHSKALPMEVATTARRPAVTLAGAGRAAAPPAMAGSSFGLGAAVRFAIFHPQVVGEWLGIPWP